MRDRLQELLRDRPGRLSDLLEIERELARVQAEIDSRESIMAALKLRVAMSTMTLNYQPKYTAASESIWRPLGDAFSQLLAQFRASRWPPSSCSSAASCRLSSSWPSGSGCWS